MTHPQTSKANHSTRQSTTLRSMLCAAGLLLVALPALAQSDAPANTTPDRPAIYQGLINDHGSALVTLKFILRSEGGFAGMFGGGDTDEQEMECPAIMVSKDGLILCATSAMEGWAAWGASRSSPTNIEVLFGDDATGVKAEVIVKDTELDLTWLRITEPAADGYTAIDLEAHAPGHVGQTIYTISRTSDFFGRGIVVNEGIINGTTTTPRELLLGNMMMVQGGSPFFDASGKLVGLTIQQMPDFSEDMDAMMSFGMDFFATSTILPADKVRSATLKALAVEKLDEEE
jgi:S1-C subfamily serine protease